jgi:OOP family OmpA-OmpF porin
MACIRRRNLPRTRIQLAIRAIAGAPKKADFLASLGMTIALRAPEPRSYQPPPPPPPPPPPEPPPPPPLEPGALAEDEMALVKELPMLLAKPAAPRLLHPGPEYQAGE